MSVREAKKRPGRSAAVIADALKHRIVRWELPDGYRLVEEKLAEEFCVSRSPVREALRHLAAEGYVEIVPRAGYRARQPSLGDIRDLYEHRLALELMVVERLARRAAKSDESLEDVKSLYALGSTAESLPEVDRALHEGLARAAGNQSIVNALERINDRLVPFRELEAEVGGRPEATPHEHKDVLDAVLAGDEVAARAAIRKNIYGALDGIEQRLGAALVRAMGGPSVNDQSNRAGGEP